MDTPGKDLVMNSSMGGSEILLSQETNDARPKKKQQYRQYKYNTNSDIFFKWPSWTDVQWIIGHIHCLQQWHFISADLHHTSFSCFRLFISPWGPWCYLALFVSLLSLSAVTCSATDPVPLNAQSSSLPLASTPGLLLTRKWPTATLSAHLPTTARVVDGHTTQRKTSSKNWTMQNSLYITPQIFNNSSVENKSVVLGKLLVTDRYQPRKHSSNSRTISIMGCFFFIIWKWGFTLL